MKRSALLVGLALVVLALPAWAALDPKKAGVDVRALAHDHPLAFCAKGARLGPDARRLCPLVDDGLDCPALAETCHAAAATSASAAAPADGERPAATNGGGSALEAFGYVAFWVLVAVLVLLIGASAANAVIRARRERAALGPLAGDEPRAAPRRPESGPRAPRDLLGEARARENSGDLEGAIYIYLDAALRALDERGAIRLASDRTNGEYVRACRERDARDALRQIVSTVESVKFGGVSPTAEHAEAARRRATKLVKGAAAALGLVLALFARDGAARDVAPTDPLGTTLLATALEAQGVAVRPSPAGLTRLPLPDASDTELPALLVDLERVHPDEDAREHLVAWVRAGGTLILLGHPELWPSDLGVQPMRGASRVVTAAKTSDPELYFGSVATPAGLATRAGGVEVPLASTGDELTYATWWQWDRGAIIGVASDEVFVDAGITHRENAEIALTILAPLRARTLWVASEVDGVEGPSSPLDSFTRAGFGSGLVHAALAVLILFAAFGVRLARAKPMPPPARRAFAEHVEATGRLYARAHVANHALAAYARMFDDRLREAVPRGTDASAYVAHRTGRPIEECAKLLDRSGDDALPPYDALALLARLVDLHESLFHRPHRKTP